MLHKLAAGSIGLQEVLLKSRISVVGGAGNLLFPFSKADFYECI
jgi:hypothetical protein